MTAADLRAALRELDLSHGGTLTARLLGLTPRTVKRLCVGDRTVTPAVAQSVRWLLLARRAGIAPHVADALLSGVHPRAVSGEPPRGAEATPPP